eukprot:515714_1
MADEQMIADEKKQENVDRISQLLATVMNKEQIKTFCQWYAPKDTNQVYIYDHDIDAFLLDEICQAFNQRDEDLDLIVFSMFIANNVCLKMYCYFIDD